MSWLRLSIVVAGAALAIGGGSALANVSPQSLTGTNSDWHGDAVASAARTTCPHGPGGVHGECVSAIASSKSESETGADVADADSGEDSATQDPDPDKDHGKTTKDPDKDGGNKSHGNQH